jgi:ribosomal protein S20
MPITKSATKALKQNLKKRSRNRHFTALLKESIKNLEINSKKTPIDKDEIKGLLSKVYSCIDKLIKKNIIHKNN